MNLLNLICCPFSIVYSERAREVYYRLEDIHKTESVIIDDESQDDQPNFRLYPNPVDNPDVPESLYGVRLPDDTFLYDNKSYLVGSTVLVVFIHGIGDYFGRYSHIKDYFNRIGISVYMFDQRYHGRSGYGGKFRINDFRQAVDDIKFVIDHRIEGKRFDRIYLMGHGYGCQLIMHLDSLHEGLKNIKPNIDGMLLVSPGTALVILNKSSNIKKRFLETLSEFFPSYPLFKHVELAKKTKRVVEKIETMKDEDLNNLKGKSYLWAYKEKKKREKEEERLKEIEKTRNPRNWKDFFTKGREFKIKKRSDLTADFRGSKKDDNEEKEEDEEDEDVDYFLYSYCDRFVDDTAADDENRILNDRGEDKYEEIKEEEEEEGEDIELKEEQEFFYNRKKKKTKIKKRKKIKQKLWMDEKEKNKLRLRADVKSSLEDDVYIYSGFMTPKMMTTLIEGGEFLYKNLDKVTSPCMVISCGDSVLVPGEEILKIFKLVKSEDIEIKFLKKGGHDILHERGVGNDVLRHFCDFMEKRHTKRLRRLRRKSKPKKDNSEYFENIKYKI